MTKLRSVDNEHYPIGSLDWFQPVNDSEEDQDLEENLESDVDMDYSLSQLEAGAETINWHTKLDHVLYLLGGYKKGSEDS